MWARRCGARPRWPSRVKVVFFSFISGTLGLSLYSYMSGMNVSSLNLNEPTSERVTCLSEWPQRYDKVFALSTWSNPEDEVHFQLPGHNEEFLAQYSCQAADLDLACRDVKLRTQDLDRPLAMAMGGSGGQYYDLLGVWALLWLVLTFVAWLGVTIHDLALIGQTQKDFILDVSGVNQHCPCIRSVWKVLAGYRPLVRLTTTEHLSTRLLGMGLAFTLAPAILVWNLAVLLFVVCPMILFAFMRYPIRMSRAWVFIISVACFLYGLGLTMQQLVYIVSIELRPQYALTWNVQSNHTTGTMPASVCTCGCDYSVSTNVCVNLGTIGLVTTVKAAFLAFRCLKGLRRSQWANLLSVTFPVPLTVYTVDWQQADGKPIRFRTEDMPVQGEVAFDPFAMMDEQPDSKFTTVHLRPELLRPEQVHCDKSHGSESSHHCRQLEMPGRPVPSKLEPAQFKAVVEAEYIGCCGFPWPTGGKKFVYDDSFLAELEAGSLPRDDTTPSSLPEIEVHCSEDQKDCGTAQCQDCGRPSCTEFTAAPQPRDHTPISESSQSFEKREDTFSAQ